MNSDTPFWKQKSLLEMSHDEWESVCDGCAKCCLTQLEDEETNLLVFTDVACELLDSDSCRCTDYENRSTVVPSCVAMNRENVRDVAEFAPPTCSYRLLLAGDDLPNWHPLVSGDRDTVHREERSVQGKVRSVKSIDIDDIQDYVVDWPNKANY